MLVALLYLNHSFSKNLYSCSVMSRLAAGRHSLSILAVTLGGAAGTVGAAAWAV